MKVLAILSQKGGVGKTTLATCLSVAAEQAGKEVAILDLDPQATASFWKDVRQLDTPAVASIQPVRLSAMLKACADGGTGVRGLGRSPAGLPSSCGISQSSPSRLSRRRSSASS